MDPLFGTNQLTDVVIAFRLVLGLVTGAAVGLERAIRKQPAGLRTHSLIAIGSTLLMLLSIWIPEHFPGNEAGGKLGDPERIAAQVVSGIGFLGAGAILRLGNNIKGLTTAASIWLVAALGLIIGAGMYLTAAVGLALSLGALIVLEPLEGKLFPEVRIKHLDIDYSGGVDFVDHIREVLAVFRIRIDSVDVQRRTGKGSAVSFLVGIPSTLDLADLYKALKALGGIQKMELKEKF